MVVKKVASSELVIHELKQGRIKLRMLGQTPLYFNSMGAKAWRDLLAGGGKKTAAEKKEIKHNPEQEFRESVYKKSTGDTHLCFPAAGVKGAMCTAALETPGITKTNVQRLIFSIVSLLSNAGTIVGIGDFRQEKGRGSYGTFSVAGSEDMGDHQVIWDNITQEDRSVQELAMDQPECADEQTADLMQFMQEERLRRAA